MTVFRG